MNENIIHSLDKLRKLVESYFKEIDTELEKLKVEARKLLKLLKQSGGDVS